MIQYQRGNVVVRAITTAVDHPDVKIWEMRLHTDYPDITYYEGGDKRQGDVSFVGVLLNARTVSRHVDARYKSPTDLRFEVPTGQQWKIMARCLDGIRLRVAAYRSRP